MEKAVEVKKTSAFEGIVKSLQIESDRLTCVTGEIRYKVKQFSPGDERLEPVMDKSEMVPPTGIVGMLVNLIDIINHQNGLLGEVNQDLKGLVG